MQLFRPNYGLLHGIIVEPYGGGTLIGKVGSKVFQRNPSGNVVRKLVLPVNPSTARQTAVRSYMTQLAESWKAITEIQRIAWEGYASNTPIVTRKGQTQHVSGRAMFMRANTLSYGAGQALIEDAPDTPGILQTTALDITISTADGMEVATEPIPVPPFSGTTLCQLQVSPPLAPGRNYYKGPYNVTSYFSPSVDTFPYAIGLYAPVAVGQKYAWRYRYFDQTGKVSAANYGTATVTA